MTRSENRKVVRDAGHGILRRASTRGMRRARIGAMGIAVGWLGACGAPSGPDVRLTIRRGSTFREAAESLSAHGMVRSARLFATYAKVRRLDRSLRYGTYVLRQKMSWEQTLDVLRDAAKVLPISA